MVRGYHVYQSIWDAANDGEELECCREIGNIHDPSAVAIRKDGMIVIYVPRAISAICSSFICRGGLILCRVSGSRRYSSDLSQGGLEVPYVLTFRVSKIKEIEKARNLIDSESASFHIKVGEVEKTENLNHLSTDTPVLESCSNQSCSIEKMQKTFKIVVPLF